MSLNLYSDNTLTVDKFYKTQQPNALQYINQELPTEEIKLGNTVFVVSREYSKTTNVTLKQRLQQTIHDRISELKWSDTPLDNLPTLAEDSVET